MFKVQLQARLIEIKLTYAQRIARSPTSEIKEHTPNLNSDKAIPLKANKAIPLKANKTIPLKANKTIPLKANKTIPLNIVTNYNIQI